jgi:hypothetical protein
MFEGTGNSKCSTSPILPRGSRNTRCESAQRDTAAITEDIAQRGDKCRTGIVRVSRQEFEVLGCCAGLPLDTHAELKWKLVVQKSAYARGFSGGSGTCCQSSAITSTTLRLSADSRLHFTSTFSSITIYGTRRFARADARRFLAGFDRVRSDRLAYDSNCR